MLTFCWLYLYWELPPNKRPPFSKMQRTGAYIRENTICRLDSVDSTPNQCYMNYMIIHASFLLMQKKSERYACTRDISKRLWIGFFLFFQESEIPDENSGLHIVYHGEDVIDILNDGVKQYDVVAENEVVCTTNMVYHLFFCIICEQMIILMILSSILKQ